jgi:cytochrome c
MKQIGIWIIGAVCIVMFNTAWAEDGAAIFKSQGCIVCHKKESSSKVNPSLSEIAAAYQGKKDQLIRYLNGESESIVRPEKSSMMKRYIKRTMALSDEDRKALADFLTGQE